MTATTCERHGRRTSVTTCASCGAGMCHDCAHPNSTGFKCPECSGHRAPSATARLKGLPRGAVAGVAAVVVIAIAAVAFWPTGGSPLSDAAVGLPDRVTFTSADGATLNGLVDVPAGDGRHPGVLIIGGYGATTAVGIGSNGGAADPLYRDMGKTLAQSGMTVLRYDKRWIGDATAEDPLTYDDRVADATAALAALRARDDVDPDRVAVLGHDEGAVIGLQLAKADASIAGLALLNPWGRPLVDVLATEFSRGLVGEDRRVHEELATTLRGAVTGLVATGTVAGRDELPPVLGQVFPAELDTYDQALFAVDPARVAAGVTAPTLIAHGAMDPCVQADEDVGRLKTVMDGPAEVDVITREGSGHSFLLGEPASVVNSDHGPTEAATKGRDQEALDQIAAWLATTLGADTPAAA